MKNIFYILVMTVSIFFGCKKEESVPEKKTDAASDKTAPVILLKGKPVDSVYLQTKYRDPGVSATDDIDGDISSSVLITGSVDEKQSGIYIINYNSRDAAGNSAAQITRSVVVSNRADILIGNYNVNCSYTLQSQFPTGPISVITQTYSSVIVSDDVINGAFTVHPFSLGPVEVVGLGMYRSADSLSITYNYTSYTPGNTTVTLSPSRQSFTILNVTTDITDPSLFYICRSIFTKK